MLRGFLVLADAIRVHPDHTWSVLRGGITNVFAARTEPIHFRGALFARIEGEPGDIGQHHFEIRLINADGDRILPQDLAGDFNIAKGGNVGNIQTDLALILPAYGVYAFILRVDNNELARWTLTAAERPATTGGPA